MLKWCHSHSPPEYVFGDKSTQVFGWVVSFWGKGHCWNRWEAVGQNLSCFTATVETGKDGAVLFRLTAWAPWLHPPVVALAWCASGQRVWGLIQSWQSTKRFSPALPVADTSQHFAISRMLRWCVRVTVPAVTTIDLFARQRSGCRSLSKMGLKWTKINVGLD